MSQFLLRLFVTSGVFSCILPYTTRNYTTRTGYTTVYHTRLTTLERALQAAIATHNRKRQAESYLNPNGPTPNKIQPKSAAATGSKSRLDVLEEQYAKLKETEKLKLEKEENEKNGTTDELLFDGTYSGKEDLGLPQFEDTKERRDKAYRDGLYSKAWIGRNEDAARAVGGERKQLESFVIKSDTGMMKPAAFKSTKSKISWNKKKK